jgi:hypothetical protein
MFEHTYESYPQSGEAITLLASTWHPLAGLAAWAAWAIPMACPVQEASEEVNGAHA